MSNANVNPGESPKRNNKKTLLFFGLGAVTTGILSFFGYRYYKAHKVKSPVQNPTVPTVKTVKTSVPKIKAKPKTEPVKLNKPAENNSSFPLKFKDKNNFVKLFQEALIKKHGNALLPSGADGIFGKQLDSALQKYNRPLVNGHRTINKALYDLLVKPQQQVKPVTQSKSIKPATAHHLNIAACVIKIRAALLLKSLSGIITALKTISNTAEFDRVNNAFMISHITSAHKMLVDALYAAFQIPADQEAIHAELLRIGLTDSDMSMGVFGSVKQNLIITNQATKVWKTPKISVPVPEKMVLGKEVSKRGSFTLFENKHQFFLVETKCINAYKN